MATTDELVYEIGIDWDKIGFGNFSDSINSGVEKITKMSAVATAAAAAIGAAVFTMGKNFGESSDVLLKTSERVRSTTADIQALTFAAEDNGSSFDSVTSALASLAKQQAEVLRGKGDFEAWAQIDVDPSKYSNTADLLVAVADGLQGISDVEKVNVMERLGLSADMLQVLSAGSKGLSDYRKEAEALGLISTPEMIAASQEFMSGWQRASSMIDGVMNKVSASLLESTVNPAIEMFNKFVSKNMDKIAKTLTSIFEVLSDASKFIFSLIQRAGIQFDRFASLIGGSENAIKALGVALVALKWSTIKSLAPAIITLGALYVAFDEIMTFMEGKESFIGDFFSLFDIGSEEAINGMSKLSDSIMLVLGKSMEGWSNILALLANSGTYFDIVLAKFDSIKSSAKLLMKTIGKELEGVMQSIASIFDWIYEKIKTVFDAIIDVPKTIIDGVEYVKDFLGFGASESIGSVAPAMATNGNTTNASISIQIDGSGNPTQTGEAVADAIKRYFDEQASRQGA